MKLMKDLEENMDKLYHIIVKEHEKGKGAGAETKRVIGNARAAVKAANKKAQSEIGSMKH